jgi:hypothetical protein
MARATITSRRLKPFDRRSAEHGVNGDLIFLSLSIIQVYLSAGAVALREEKDILSGENELLRYCMDVRCRIISISQLLLLLL